MKINRRSQDEAENASSELFGDPRMLEVIQEHREKTPREIILAMEAAILEHVSGYPQSDDITMMAMMLKE